MLQTQLIEDLLNVSRILRGKLVLNTDPVSLANTIEADQQQALAAGFQQHIAKPVEPDELVRAIARLVEHP